MALREAVALALGGLLFTCVRAQAQKLTGTWQVRREHWKFFKLPGTDSDYAFLGSSLKLNFEGGGKRQEWHLELNQVTLLWLPSNAPTPSHGALYRTFSGNREGSLLLRQLFGRWKSNGNCSVQIGRFKFSDGMERPLKDTTLLWLRKNRVQERLISFFDFSLIGRSFDGLQFVSDHPEGTLTFALLRPTKGVFDLKGNDELSNITLVYGSWAFSPDRQTDARFFALYYRDSRKPPRTVKVDNRPIDLRRVDDKKISILTLGGHLLRVVSDQKGKTDFLAWGAWQTGDWGLLKHRAFAMATEFGQQWNVKFKPWLRLGFSLSTGDGIPYDGYHKTFFQVLPSPNMQAIPPIYNLMNNRDLFAQLILTPSHKLDLRVEGHWVFLSRKADLWYSGSGAFNDSDFGYLGMRGGERRLLNLIGLTANYTPNPMTTLTIHLKLIRGKEVVRANFGSDSATYAYLQLLRRW